MTSGIGARATVRASDRPSLRAIARINRLSLIGCIFFGPLVFLKGPTHDPFGVPKMSLVMWAVAIAGACQLFEWIAIGRWSWSARLLIAPSLVTIPLLVSWLVSPYRTWTDWGLYSRFQGAVPYLVFGVFSVLVALSFQARQRQIAWAIASAGSLVGLYLMIQMMGLDPWGAVVEGTTLTSTASTVGNSNFVGGFLAIALPLCLYLWTSNLGRVKLLAMLLTALVCEGLLLSLSQGGQAAALAGSATFLAARASPGMRIRRLLIGGSVGVGAVLVAFVVLNLVNIRTTHSALLRSHWWLGSVQMASDHPVVGVGPNAYAVEAARYRTLRDAVAHRSYFPAFTPLDIDYQTSDDPHSVPLSFLANAGVLGLIGFCSAMVWTLGQGFRTAKHDELAAAFTGACAAYLVQSLVSVDEVTLRIGFWTVAGALGSYGLASQAARTPPHPGDLPIIRMLTAGVAALVVGAAIAIPAADLLRADLALAKGSKAFVNENASSGEEYLRKALKIHNDPVYRQILAEHWGLTAIRQEQLGRPYLEKMIRLNRYLEEFPRPGAIAAYARILNYWGDNDPAIKRHSLAVYARARNRDPANPLPRIEQAEVLLDLGFPDRGLRLLQEAPALDSPEYWAALAMLNLATDNLPAATSAQARATSLDDDACRVLLMNELLRVADQEDRTEPPGGLPITLDIACDQGLYQRFVRQLPPPLRRHY